MNKVPLPVAIGLVIVAILIAVFAMRRSGGGFSDIPTPTGPPTAGMEQMKKSADAEARR